MATFGAVSAVVGALWAVLWATINARIGELKQSLADAHAEVEEEREARRADRERYQQDIVVRDARIDELSEKVDRLTIELHRMGCSLAGTCESRVAPPNEPFFAIGHDRRRRNKYSQAELTVLFGGDRRAISPSK